MNNNIKPNRKNLLKQNYLSGETNYVICIDHTKLGQQGFFFCAIDLAARNKKQETRNKKQETRNKKQETRNKKQETRNKKQETRNKKQETL